MGRKSTKENKNVYQLAREKSNYTRAQASCEIGFMSESVIEKIENGTIPDPEEVVAMASAYRSPELCNYYCNKECAIGKVYVPEIKTTELSQIALQTLSSLNSLEKQKERLIDITLDGEISPEEYEDFAGIQKIVNQISMAADAMNLWIEKSIAVGKINREELDSHMK